MLNDRFAPIVGSLCLSMADRKGKEEGDYYFGNLIVTRVLLGKDATSARIDIFVLLLDRGENYRSGSLTEWVLKTPFGVCFSFAASSILRTLQTPHKAVNATRRTSQAPDKSSPLLRDASDTFPGTRLSLCLLRLSAETRGENLLLS
jgi:hypothetical protein